MMSTLMVLRWCTIALATIYSNCTLNTDDIADNIHNDTSAFILPLPYQIRLRSQLTLEYDKPHIRQNFHKLDIE